jgi:VWFA-related protein
MRHVAPPASLAITLAVLCVSAFLLGDEPATFSTDVNVVNILATVRDKDGRIVNGLTRDDFLLEEDGRPQMIRYFSQEFNAPLTLGLLVDTSLSQVRVLEPERRASRAFLREILRPEKDRAFVIHFDREVELLQDLTSSRKELEDAIDSLDVPRDRGVPQNRRPTGEAGGGRFRGAVGTALYDSVLLASDELMKKQNGRKALILLSDGVDFGSKVSLASAIESAQRADTLVYAIWFSDETPIRDFGPGGGRRGPWGGMGGGGGRGGGGQRRGPQMARRDGRGVLQRIAFETGGRYFEVSAKQPIEKIYSVIEEELRNQYNLGFNPAAATSGAYHRLRLTTKKKDYTVTAREGYYTKP